MLEAALPAYQHRLLSGNDDVDKWTEQRLWDAVLKNIRIVVSTPQVLLDALTHGFVKMTKLALLIFDEAHRSLGNTPMNQIMSYFYHPLLTSGSRLDAPNVLGLTASPVMNDKAEALE